MDISLQIGGNAGDMAALLTAIDAFAGLILSIFNLITQHRSKKPRLRPAFSTGVVVSGSGTREEYIAVT